VIEDSFSGVAGAQAAGMQVVGFTGGGHCRPGHAARLREAGCTEVFAAMPEFAALLSRA
jgi:beta-phosphoglucomutase-like phosphatase (HAD superfamily)